MNKKGFLLIDSLFVILIVTVLATICFNVYKSKEYYIEGYQNYREEMNRTLSDIYNGLVICEKCIIQEDSSNLEP